MGHPASGIGILLMNRITDIHGHFVFGVDDGAMNMEMSIEMIRMSRAQGVRDIICASHSWGNRDRYTRNFAELRSRVLQEMPDVALHPGTEIACDYGYMPMTIKQLNEGRLSTLGSSRHALLEFGTHVSGEELMRCVECVNNAGYTAVIAHPERYIQLPADAAAMAFIRNNRIPLQINAYSLVEEKNLAIRSFARALLSEGLVAYVGSDGHRVEHRTPSISTCVGCVMSSCLPEYGGSGR